VNAVTKLIAAARYQSISAQAAILALVDGVKSQVYQTVSGVAAGVAAPGSNPRLAPSSAITETAIAVWTAAANPARPLHGIG
jgi:hypothetical protein